MYINNEPLSKYNAKLLGRIILPSETTINTFWGDNSLTPYTDKKPKHRYKLLNLKIEFKGTAEEIEINKSKLLKDMQISTITFKAIDRRFKGNIVGSNVNTQTKGFEVLQINFQAFQFGEEEIISVQNKDTINLPSTADTPVKLSIIPDENISELEILGFGEDIIIKNLVKDYEAIIDGEKGLVTEEGQNKWKDYESWGFPKLSPGENEISISEDIEITAIYSPRWL